MQVVDELAASCRLLASIEPKTLGVCDGWKVPHTALAAGDMGQVDLYKSAC